MKNLGMHQYISGLDQSGWLQHIRAILDASLLIAQVRLTASISPCLFQDLFQTIEMERKNVLVHCSDGWDRTSQCCALASLLLCSYYRSVHGFRVRSIDTSI